MAPSLMKSKGGHSQPFSLLQKTMLIILLALNVVFAKDTVDVTLEVLDTNGFLVLVSGKYVLPFDNKVRNILNYNKDFAKSCFYRYSLNILGKKIPFPDNIYFSDAESEGLFRRHGYGRPDTMVVIDPRYKPNSFKHSLKKGVTHLCSKDNLGNAMETEISCDISAVASATNTIKSSFENENSILKDLFEAGPTVGMTSKYGSAIENSPTASTTILTPYRGKVPPNKYSVVEYQLSIGMMEETVRYYVNLTGYVLVTFAEPFEGDYSYFFPAFALDDCAGQGNRFIDKTYKIEYAKNYYIEHSDFDRRSF